MFALNCNIINHTKLFIIYFISFIAIIRSQENNCISKEVDTKQILKKKCETISNGNNVCVQNNGIFIYNSVLTDVLFNYDFSSFTNITERIELGLISITEFKEVDNKKDYIVLCFIKSQYLFILSYEGEFIFYYSYNETLINDKYFIITPYKYDELKKEYYFAISYAYSNFLIILYNKINIQSKSNKLLKKINYKPFFMREYNTPSVVSRSGSSCESLSEGNENNVITCFFISESNNKYFSSVSFLPDLNFTVFSNYTYNLGIKDFDLENLKSIKSAHYYKTKALICLTNTVIGKCLIYNSFSHQLTETNSELSSCKDFSYAININYFQKTKEFIFSCVPHQNYLMMIKFPYDLNGINDNVTIYQFEGSCTTPYGYSIIYLSPFKLYSIIIDLDCGSTKMLKDYLLTENINECDNIKNEIEEGRYSEYVEEDDKNEESTPKAQSSEIKESTIIVIELSDKQQQNYDTIHTTYQPHLNEKINKFIETNQIKDTIQNTLNNQIIETETNALKTQNIINSQTTESSQNNYSFNSIDFSLETIKATESIQKIDSTKRTELKEIADSSKITELKEITDSSKITELNQISDLSKITELNEITDSSKKTELNKNSDSPKITESNEFIDSSKTTQSNEIIDSSEIKQSSLISVSINSKSSHISDINEPSQTIESSQIIKSSEFSEYLLKNTQNENIICDKKCLECDEESNARNLCIKCNNKNNYYALKLNNEIEEENKKYIQCYSEETKILNYYLNKNENIFEPCYYTCGTCKEMGDQNDHKCLTCGNNYRMNPNKNNSCVIECKYFFYFTNFGEYKCTNDNQCPEEANILIKDLSKCTSNCKDEEDYKFQYNGECIKLCPDGTEINNETKICQMKDKYKCSYSLFELYLDNTIQKNGIEKVAKDYVKEFNYTNIIDK